MDDTFAPELEQIFAQHKVDDEIKKYLLGLTPPIATVASFASLVGPDDDLTTLLFDPAGISALEPTARTPAKANLRAAMAQAKATFAVACGPKETHSTPTADDPDAAVDDGTKKNGVSCMRSPNNTGDVAKRKRLVTLGRAGKPEYSRP